METNPQVPEEKLGEVPVFLNPIYRLDSPERTLGHAAVAQSNIRAALIELMNTHPEDSDEYRALQIDHSRVLYQTKYELEEVRRTVAAVDDAPEQIMDRYLQLAMPAYLLSLRAYYAGPNQEEASWKETLSRVNDDELLSIVQRHNYIVEQQATSENIDLSFEIQKHLFIRASNRLYDEGYLTLLPKDVESIELVIGDVFDMAMKERGGYYQPGGSEVAIRQGMVTERSDHKWLFLYKNEKALLKDMPVILMHELVHAVLCRTYEVPGNPLAARWINEAMTETVSQLMQRKNGIPVGELQAYSYERQLMELLLSKSVLPYAEAFKLMTRAFSGEDADTTAFTILMNESFDADDVLEKINHAITFEEDRLIREGHARDRSVQIDAVGVVYKKMNTDPSLVLLQGADGIMRRVKQAAYNTKK